MSRWSQAQSVGRVLLKLGKAGAKAYQPSQRSSTKPSRSPSSKPGPRPGPGRPTPGRPTPPAQAPRQRAADDTAYRGDFTGHADITFAPRADGDADPGEVVWAWVPYEDDPTQGKDRPVLVIAMVGQDLLGLMLTSKDHDRDRDDGRRWFDLGTGDWDRQGRPSEVRLDRVLRLAPSAAPSRRPPYVVRVRRWTGPGSTRSRPRRGTRWAGDTDRWRPRGLAHRPGRQTG